MSTKLIVFTKWECKLLFIVKNNHKIRIFHGIEVDKTLIIMKTDIVKVL